MVRRILLCAPLLSAGSASPPALALEYVAKAPEFVAWALEHGKAYGTLEGWRRAYENYAGNGRVIEALREQDAAEYGHTKFSDLSPREFKARYFGAPMDPAIGKMGGGRVEGAGLKAMPDAIDWRDAGAVTPVKDQQSCGSCWAESAVGSIESAWFLANRDSLASPVPLSTEQVIECDDHDNACYGGYPRGAYQYAVGHGGLAAAADYPYNVMGHTICLANQTFNQTCGDGMCDDPPLTNFCDATCSDKSHSSVAHIASWNALPTAEDQIAAYLAQHGPVSVCIDASGGALGILIPWLQFYKSGIADPRRCTTTLDHAVLLVGYGEEGGKKYWIIKNSWGLKWGEDGFFRLVRGEGRCGVNLLATAAVVKAGDTAIVI